MGAADAAGPDPADVTAMVYSPSALAVLADPWVAADAACPWHAAALFLACGDAAYRCNDYSAADSSAATAAPAANIAAGCDLEAAVK